MFKLNNKSLMFLLDCYNVLVFLLKSSFFIVALEQVFAQMLRS